VCNVSVQSYILGVAVAHALHCTVNACRQLLCCRTHYQHIVSIAAVVTNTGCVSVCIAPLTLCTMLYCVLCDGVLCCVQLAPLQELKAIWGVGPVTAQKWINMGISSVKQLRAAEKRQQYNNLLTRNQSTGTL
jgi:Fingers domain of DNA polymerase lambda